jgi:hypothetical protein
MALIPVFIQFKVPTILSSANAGVVGLGVYVHFYITTCNPSDSHKPLKSGVSAITSLVSIQMKHNLRIMGTDCLDRVNYRKIC